MKGIGWDLEKQILYLLEINVITIYKYVLYKYLLQISKNIYEPAIYIHINSSPYFVVGCTFCPRSFLRDPLSWWLSAAQKTTLWSNKNLARRKLILYTYFLEILRDTSRRSSANTPTHTHTLIKKRERHTNLNLRKRFCQKTKMIKCFEDQAIYQQTADILNLYDTVSPSKNKICKPTNGQPTPVGGPEWGFLKIMVTLASVPRSELREFNGGRGWHNQCHSHPLCNPFI